MPRIGQWEPIQIHFCKCSHQFGEHFLAFGHRKVFQAHIGFCSLGIRYFSKEPYFLFSGEWYLETKFWLLVLIATGVSFFF